MTPDRTPRVLRGVLRAVVVGAVAAALALTAPAPAHADSSPSPAAPTDTTTTVTTPVAPAGPTATPGVTRLDRLLQRRVADRRLGANVSLLVLDAMTGEVLSARNPDTPMQAASNMKILTAMTALATMGPDRRFPTRVTIDGDHLIIVGGGDSLLARDDVRLMARSIAAALGGQARVTVDVDTSLFPEATFAPGWVDAYVGSSIGSVQSLSFLGDRSRRGAYVVADALVTDLKALGITASPGGYRQSPPGAPVLAEFAGHSMQEAVGRMLNASDSAVAEVLFRQVALATGRPPTWEGAQEAAVAVLTSLGLDLTGAVLLDGSGLSRDDRLTPRLITSALRLAAVTNPAPFTAMFLPTALAVAGRTGTLTPAYGRYSTKPSKCAAGRVQAKTGTILSTIALSGLAWTRDQTPRIFSIIVNDRPQRFDVLDTRRAVDGLAATVTGCWT